MKYSVNEKGMAIMETWEQNYYCTTVPDSKINLEDLNFPGTKKGIFETTIFYVYSWPRRSISQEHPYAAII